MLYNHLLLTEKPSPNLPEIDHAANERLAKKRILETANILFLQKGFEDTTLQDIMNESGLSKGAIYHYFKSKEDIIDALNNEMFLESNPFDAVRNRSDLLGLQKMKMAMMLNQSDEKRIKMSKQALPILKNPRILAGIIDSNRRLLTPFWRELIDEGNEDGSIQTQFARELSELIPLLEFWMTPSIYPATTEQLYNKFLFIGEMLNHMELPLIDDEILDAFQKAFHECVTVQTALYNFMANTPVIQELAYQP